MVYSDKDRNEINLVLDGEKLKNKEQLLMALKEGLCFPNYFGFNWDALQDCITDLSWLKGVSKVDVAIKNSNKLMSDESESSRQTFLEIMDYAVSFWQVEKEGSLPFPGMDVSFSYTLE